MRRLIVLGILVASISCAQEGERSPRGPEGPVNPLLAACDTDQDGALSSGELRSAGAALRKLDANGDGVLAANEIRPASAPQGGPGGSVSQELLATLMSFDQDGNGELSSAEVPERMQGIFARGDTNTDGILSRDELASLTAAQASSSGGEPGRSRGRGGRERGLGGFGADPVFAAVDVDRDSAISASEIDGAGAALLRLDGNGDGELTADEVRPRLERGRR